MYVTRAVPGHVLRAVIRDVTRRKALEAELRRAAETASRMERLAVVGRLAAGVAHEINNPAAFIKSNLELMRREMARAHGALAALPEDGEERRRTEALVHSLGEMVTDALAGVEHIVSIVRSMKGVARQRPGERVLFSPLQAVQDAIALFRGSHKDGAVDFEAGDLPQVAGAPGAFGQVILNLLENGLDAMGGRGRLRVRGEVLEDRVRLLVIDTGTGIPPPVAEHLFEPFFTTKEPGKGTGLGLVVSREIIQQMGGNLSFETGSEGTTFIVEVPLGAGAPRAVGGGGFIGGGAA
jgi:signal transduction histidine kinase